MNASIARNAFAVVALLCSLQQQSWAQSVVWSRLLGREPVILERGIGLAVTGDGGVYVAAGVASADGLFYDGLFARYDADGSESWRRTEPRTYYGPVGGNGTAGFYAVTYRHDANYAREHFFERIDAQGSVVWSQPWIWSSEGDGFEYLDAVATDLAGDVQFAGFTYEFRRNPLRLPKRQRFDAEGNSLSVQELGPPPFNLSSNEEFTFDDTGSLYGASFLRHPTPVSGGYENFGESVRKFDGTGNVEWVTAAPRPISEHDVHDLTVDASGNVFLASTGIYFPGVGSLAEPGAYDNFYFGGFVSRFDATGALQWTADVPAAPRFPDVDVVVYPVAVAADGMGGAWVATPYVYGSHDVVDGTIYYGLVRQTTFVRRFAADGQLIWQQEFPGLLSHSLVADGEGQVFLAGGFGFDGDANGYFDSYDLFLAKLAPVPESTTFTMAALGAVLSIAIGRQRWRLCGRAPLASVVGNRALPLESTS